MKRFFFCLLGALVVLGTLSGCMQSPATKELEGETAQDYDQVAQEVLHGILERDYAKASQHFDASLMAFLPETKLFSDWNRLEQDIGEYVENAGISRWDGEAANPLLTYTLSFQRGYCDLLFAFTREHKLMGITLSMSTQVPGKERFCPASVTEEEIMLGEGDAPLSGTLSYPKEVEGPVPLLILVHGSGANDRNESLGLLRPFQDIAWGLGERGIAVLRYEKRSKTYPLEMQKQMEADTFTVKEETVDDALLAVAFSQMITAFDVGKIYVLGHSLGGMLLPRIAERAEGISGYLFMAAPARPLEDLIMEQMEYLFSLEQNTETEPQLLIAMEQQIQKLREQRDRIQTLIPGDKVSPQEILGMNVAYLLDLKGYLPQEAALAMKEPLLFLQGERDYQVTMEDFALYRTALSEKANAVFCAYEKLNHFFVEGKGKSTPTEYYALAQIPEYVLDDMAAFLTK